MKKLALILGLILITTPLMAQEFIVDIAQPKIVKKQLAKLEIDNINKVTTATIEFIDENGNVAQRDRVVFENLEEQTELRPTGTIYVYNVTINGDNQQIESDKVLTEYEGNPVTLDGTKPKMEEVVVQEADNKYNKFMTAIDINATALKNAIKTELGL